MGSAVSRLALGTAQFGLTYGIANRTGQVAREAVERILLSARSSGLDTLDTAIAYGSSEALLGEIGTAGWRIISKIPPVPQSEDRIGDWLRSNLTQSCARLRASCLHAVLLHRPSDLLGAHGAEIYSVLLAAKEAGQVHGVGVSIYNPEELDELISRFKFDLVQAPFNLIDRRLETSGWLERLRAMGVEVHTRSAFLQGLLLMDRAQMPSFFDRWQHLWSHWREWQAASGVSAVQACLSFALSRPEIDRVVVGVDNIDQLQELVVASTCTVPEPPRELASCDADLLNPFRWPRI